MISKEANCKICNSESKFIFKAQVLHKYDVSYFQCTNCSFIQTEEPYWLNEAYQNAIADVDTGIVTRNLVYSSIVNLIIRYFFNTRGKFLDYGGGYGLFVRLMRDKGRNFYRYDKYSENLFARWFDMGDLPENNWFELITLFEVFEHLNNPIEEVMEILSFGKSILFTTELVPSKKLTSTSDWWYFSPEAGQHISFYTVKSLSSMASKLGCYFYSNGKNLHLITNKKFKINPVKIPYLFKIIIDKVLKRNFFNMKSLIKNDFTFTKTRITSHK